MLWCTLMPACQLHAVLLWLCLWLNILGKPAVSFWPLELFQVLPLTLHFELTFSSAPILLHLRPDFLYLASFWWVTLLGWPWMASVWLYLKAVFSGWTPLPQASAHLLPEASSLTSLPSHHNSQVHPPCTWLHHGLPICTYACGPFSTWNTLSGIFYLLLT